MELKIMTSNVWADVFGNPVEGRDDNLVTVYLRWRPDILCLQEMHPHWHESAVPAQLVQKGYAAAEPILAPGALNYTPLYYRTELFRPVKAGFHLYTGPNDYDSKSVTWVLLQEKATGTLIGTMATHLYHESNEYGNAARVQNCTELLEIAKQLQKDGAVAVFCGGDMNCNNASQPLTLLRQSGMTCAALLAPKLDTDICSWHDSPVMDEQGVFHATASTLPNDQSLDHILALGSTVCTRYHVVTDQEALDATDHCPVFTVFQV